MDRVQEKITDVIEELLGVQRSAIVPEARFIEELGADSLDGVFLMMALEEVFDIDIPDSVYDTVKTVGHAMDYVRANAKEEKLK